MSKIKKKLLLFILFLNFMPLFAITFEIKGNTQAIKLPKSEYTPDFITETETQIFINFDYIYNNFFIEFSPSLKIGKKVNFNFEFLSLLFASDYFTVDISKKNIYFGNGLDVNPLFYNLPIQNPYDKNLWNTKISYINDNIKLSLGAVIDSEKIDNFEKPDWHNFFFTSLFSNENFSLYCNIDYLSSKNQIIKFASEFDFTQISNLTLYTSANYKINFSNMNLNSYDFLSGSSYFIDNEKIDHLYIAETGLKNKKNFVSLCAQWNILDLFSFEERFSYVDESINLLSKLIFNFSKGNIKIEYKSPNLRNIKQRNDFFSISYELLGDF